MLLFIFFVHQYTPPESRTAPFQKTDVTVKCICGDCKEPRVHMSVLDCPVQRIDTEFHSVRHKKKRDNVLDHFP